jgi:hypothetical protein
MSDAIITTGAADELREAAITLLADAAESLVHAVSQSQRQQLRSCVVEAHEKLQRSFALLDALGWSEALEPTDTNLRLGGDRRALGETVSLALTTLAGDLAEVRSVPDRLTDLEERRRLEQRCERVLELHGVAAALLAASERGVVPTLGTR